MGIYVDLIDYNVSYKFDGKYHGQAYAIPEGSEYHIAYGHYDHGHDAKWELVRKTPFVWGRRVPTLFLRKSGGLKILNENLYREMVKFI